MIRMIPIVLLGLLLAACGHGGPASIAGGECKIFEAPQYEVRGKRQYDQDWIDSQVEGGVGGCRWKRPQPRPASIDAAPAPRPAVAKPAKRRGIVARIRDRVMPAKEWPAAAPPIEPAPVVVPPPAPAPRPPRSAIDRLLSPRDDD
ncbi:hypothetical protein [Bradyrhizobium sp. I71]|uniref:hypothetical protein n=1 Tax=Bradyrhizobium sp. I71 TaxID=2590772 RepID=UPI001EF78F6C|nr:hypothetical protein [Bradyrhizobium sp. I71]ULK98833.1 hypothetical protein FJV43_03555 [Bradyrhizobium sp. I71]